MLFQSGECGGGRLAGGSLVKGYARSIVGERDAVLLEGGFDPPVGLGQCAVAAADLQDLLVSKLRGTFLQSYLAPCMHSLRPQIW